MFQNETGVNQLVTTPSPYSTKAYGVSQEANSEKELLPLVSLNSSHCNQHACSDMYYFKSPENQVDNEQKISKPTLTLPNYSTTTANKPLLLNLINNGISTLKSNLVKIERPKTPVILSDMKSTLRSQNQQDLKHFDNIEKSPTKPAVESLDGQITTKTNISDTFLGIQQHLSTSKAELTKSHHSSTEQLTGVKLDASIELLKTISLSNSPITSRQSVGKQFEAKSDNLDKISTDFTHLVSSNKELPPNDTCIMPECDRVEKQPLKEIIQNNLIECSDENEDLDTTDEFMMAELTMIDLEKTMKESPGFKHPMSVSKSTWKQRKCLEPVKEEEMGSDSEDEVLIKALSKLNIMKLELESTTKLVESLLKKRKNSRKMSSENKENCPSTSSKKVKEVWINELKYKNPGLLKTPQAVKKMQLDNCTWTPHSLSAVLNDQMDDLFE